MKMLINKYESVYQQAYEVIRNVIIQGFIVTGNQTCRRETFLAVRRQQDSCSRVDPASRAGRACTGGNGD